MLKFKGATTGCGEDREDTWGRSEFRRHWKGVWKTGNPCRCWDQREGGDIGARHVLEAGSMFLGHKDQKTCEQGRALYFSLEV